MTFAPQKACRRGLCRWRVWEAVARLNLLSLRRWCHSSTPIFPVGNFSYRVLLVTDNWTCINTYWTEPQLAVVWVVDFFTTTINTVSFEKQRDCLVKKLVKIPGNCLWNMKALLRITEIYGHFRVVVNDFAALTALLSPRVNWYSRPAD